jgi:hypothetical protein
LLQQHLISSGLHSPPGLPNLSLQNWLQMSEPPTHLSKRKQSLASGEATTPVTINETLLEILSNILRFIFLFSSKYLRKNLNSKTKVKKKMHIKQHFILIV